MSGCLALDETLPALTSRLLLLLEDEEDLLVLKPPMATRRLEECKEPEESPMAVSPCSNSSNNVCGINFHSHEKHSFSLWSTSVLPIFDAIPECGLPSIPSRPLPPTPATPLSRKGMGGLFASFPSSPNPQDLWQYGNSNKSCHYSTFLSPRTTDAVFEESKKAAVEAVWCSPEARPKNRGSNININKPATILKIPPMAPSLLPLPDDLIASSDHSNCPPSFILYRTRSGSGSSSNGFDLDDDEVSLLADDPDEDDAGILPPATYDVVVNILDEIDRDNAAIKE